MTSSAATSTELADEGAAQPLGWPDATNLKSSSSEVAPAGELMPSHRREAKSPNPLSDRNRGTTAPCSEGTTLFSTVPKETVDARMGVEMRGWRQGNDTARARQE